MTISSVLRRNVPLALTLGLLAICTPAARGQEAPVAGNIVGITEEGPRRAAQEALDAAALIEDQVGIGIGLGGSIDDAVLIDLAAEAATLGMTVSAALDALDPGSVQPTTDRDALVSALSELSESARNLELALTGSRADGLSAKRRLRLLRGAAAFARDVQVGAREVGRIVNGLRRAPKAPVPAGFTDPETLFEYLLSFNAGPMRRLDKGAGAVRDPSGGKDVKVKNAKAKAAHDSVAVGKKKSPRNRYLSFKPRNKKVEDGAVFFDLRREWRGPFEFGFTGGVFTDAPKPERYRGNAFVGMEVDLLHDGPREFVSANVRYAVLDDAGTQEGVQVFVTSHLGDHGQVFLQGAKRADVKVVFENDIFEVFAKPAGASDGAFRSVGTYEHDEPGSVWNPGVGAANMTGKVELGIDDVFARALGGETPGGGGGGGGGGIEEPAASALVQDEPFVPTQIVVEYLTAQQRLQVRLTNAGRDQINVGSPDGTTGPGEYTPRSSSTSYLDLVGLSFQTYTMLTGQGTLTIELLDLDAKIARGTFSFTGRRGGGTLREITEGTFETDRLTVR